MSESPIDPVERLARTFYHAYEQTIPAESRVTWEGLYEGAREGLLAAARVTAAAAATDRGFTLTAHPRHFCSNCGHSDDHALSDNSGHLMATCTAHHCACAVMVEAPPSDTTALSTAVAGKVMVPAAHHPDSPYTVYVEQGTVVHHALRSIIDPRDLPAWAQQSGRCLHCEHAVTQHSSGAFVWSAGFTRENEPQRVYSEVCQVPGCDCITQTGQSSRSTDSPWTTTVSPSGDWVAEYGPVQFPDLPGLSAPEGLPKRTIVAACDHTACRDGHTHEVRRYHFRHGAGQDARPPISIVMCTDCPKGECMGLIVQNTPPPL